MIAEISNREAMRRTFRVAHRAEPRLLATSIILGVAAFVPAALTIVWLGLLIIGALQDRNDFLILAGVGLAFSGAGGWLFRMWSERRMSLLNERATIALESHIARLQGRAGTIEHFERPEFNNRLVVLRDQVWRIVNIYGSTITAAGAIIRLLITLTILTFVHPLFLLLTIFVLPLLVISNWRGRVLQRTWLAGAPSKRLARHLFELQVSPGPAKELRVAGTRELVERRRQEAVQASYGPESHERLITAACRSAAWVVFGAAYIASVGWLIQSGQADSGGILIALVAGANLAMHLTAAVGQVADLRFMMGAAQQLAWLERWVEEHEEHGTHLPPERLTGGIEFRNVSFRYPGRDEEVLDSVDLSLAPRSVVALVGENGAGKTTLIKLLSRFYAPTGGQILVDGIDLQTIKPEAWRERITGAFQDAFKFEYSVGQSIGIGDLPRLTDHASISGAVERGAAKAVVDSLPAGLETQLGKQWPGGVDLSAGQWQRIALARGLMRRQPLVLMLDEPTASLDPQTEYQLFQHFAQAARRSSGVGTITILVSHRFSTVRMADQIIVLQGKRIVEQGSHSELMAARGLYAELFGIQAAAYEN